MDFKDLKKKAKGLAEDISNPKNLAKSLNPEKVVDSIGDAINGATKKTKEGGDVIINVKDNVFSDLAKATSSAYTSLTGGIENAKNLTPDKIVSNMFKKVWKEDRKVLGITVTRGQEIYCAISFLVAAVLFLGMDLSLLIIDHEFENLKYSIFFSIWALSFLLGIRILDRAVPDQFFEKKSKNVRIIAVVLYAITLIGSVVVANVIDAWTISLVAFIVHFVSLAWLTNTHIPAFKGFNLSLFTEKTPLLISNFYNSVEK